MPDPILLSDAEARARALDTASSFIVEAPAGSGKTGLLIQRFLLLLAEGDVEQPEQVLAITFTRKATAEMRHRIVQSLEDAAHPLTAEEVAALSSFKQTTRAIAAKVLARDAQFGWGLLQQPQRLNIRTIDSLCSEIAGRLPILSGLGGKLQPVDDARALYAEAARRTLEELASGDATITDALRTVLLHRDGRLGEVQNLLAEMLAKRDQWARLIPIGGELEETYLNAVVRPRLESVLRGLITAALEHAANVIDEDDLLALAELGLIAAQNLSGTGKANPLEICLDNPTSPETEASCVGHWRALSCLLLTQAGEWRSPAGITVKLGFAANSPEKARMQQMLTRLSGNESLREALSGLNELPPAQYTEHEWVVSKALFHLLHWGMAKLRIVFTERRQCDFTELSMASIEALAHGDGGLSAAMGMSFRHLLVDEMQDTSISQYGLLQRLTQGWDGSGQTVFLVGDPRQSIYLFRQARVEQFTRAISEASLGDVPLEHLRLTANFRSHHALVAAFNAHFELIRPQQIDAYDGTPHTPAIAEREILTTRSTDADSEHKGLHWHAEVIAANPSKSAVREASATVRKREAEEIASLVQTWCERRVEGEKSTTIAVLVRAKSHLLQVSAALRERGIAYRAVEIDALSERQEVLDALSLLRALLHPADRVAWLSVLRAPWCGLSLRDLHTLTGSDDVSLNVLCVDELITQRASLLSVEGQKRLLRTQSILQAATAQHGRQALSQWLEGAWRSLGAALYLTPDEYANVQSFFHLLDECEEQGDVIDANLLLERLQTLFAPDAQSEDVHVELMTIHKAKGLEWDVVLVPSLDRRGGRGDQPLLEWLENPARRNPNEHELAAELAIETLALLAPIPRKGVSGASLHAYVRGLREQVERMELRRVFYVATTRAREELHLFGQLTASATGLRPKAGTLLHAAWPAAEQHFVASQSQGGTSNVVTMPSPSGPTVVTQIAAEAAPKPRTVRRMPESATGYVQSVSAPLPKGDAIPVTPQRSYTRAEGSLSARALGSVVHAYFDRLAQEFAASASTESLAKAVENWLPGITAMLRSYGLAPNEVQSRATQVLAALRATLDSPEGQWLLMPHPEAASEFAITTWTNESPLATYRMDRRFYAGSEALKDGKDFLWIVDYKISAQDENADEAAFAAESEKHRSQLEAYARVQEAALAGKGIRLAAFYPLRTKGSKLRVWTYEAGAKV